MKRVRVSRVCGTDEVNYSAWEPTTMCARGNEQLGAAHGTISFFPSDEAIFEPGWYGRVGTRRVGEDVLALRAGSDERVAAVVAHIKAQEDEAYAAILARFPEAAKGRRVGGEIRVVLR